jgi:chorismate mutase
VSDLDPTLRDLRDQISHNDRRLLDALNTRLELVAELKRYKESRAIDFVDPRREEQLLAELERVNDGPLSAAAVREFFTEVLALTKRELSDEARRR